MVSQQLPSPAIPAIQGQLPHGLGSAGQAKIGCCGKGGAGNPLSTLPGVIALTVALDYMHSKYLGMDQHMFGSTLYVLCYMVMTGTPEENVARCWAFVQRYYKEHRATTR